MTVHFDMNFTFILLLVICRILSFLATWIPFSFSTALYDIQSCSRVSPTASNPVKFFILFRAKFKITKFFSPFKFAILSIEFVHKFNFLQFTSTNNLKMCVTRWHTVRRWMALLSTYAVSILSQGGIWKLKSMTSASAGSCSFFAFHFANPSFIDVPGILYFYF